MNHRLLLLLLFTGITLSCTRKPSAPSDSDAFGEGVRMGELKGSRMAEISGLAASEANAGLLWLHNDSGHRAEVFLVDSLLEIRAAYLLEGIRNRDWEDIAVGPGPVQGKQFVYVADIGDNNATSTYKYIYRFEEPVLVPGTNPGTIRIRKFDTIVFRLEDQRKDMEALMVHPATGDLYLVSKREKPVYVYHLKAPLPGGDTVVAKRLFSLPYSNIVAADIAADGSGMLLKNYDNVFYWKLDGRLLQDSVPGRPQVLRYKPEPQGEAIGFARDGSGYYTLSEKQGTEKTYLYFYPREQR